MKIMNDSSDIDVVTDWVHLGNLLCESIQLPVSIHTADPARNILWSSGRGKHPAFADPAELIRSVMMRRANSPYPVLRSTHFLEQFLLVPVNREGILQAVIVIGPAVFIQPSEEIAANLMNDFDIPRKDRADWVAYWKALPVASRMRMLHIGVLAHLTVNGEALQLTDVLQHSLDYALPNGPRENLNIALTNQRETLFSHSGRDFEKRMLDLIRSGKPEELMKITAEFSSMKVGVLSKRSQLRNLKNLAICGIAIATRAAVDGGLYEELAYTLSDLHIQHIEELSDAIAVETALNQAFADFAERVRQSRRSAVSRPVHACQEYIFNHLYEEIASAELAELAGLHLNYLSHLFKEETGLTLMNYIQRERIEEAKKLLERSRDSISSIGLRLCFYDHAHFVRVFKKHAGMTPKQYRELAR